MSFPMAGIQANLPFSPLDLGFQGQTSPFDFQGIFRRHHHHHHHCDQNGGEDSGCQGSGENQQLEQLGQNMMQTGEDMVPEGQQLIQQGDFRQGMQLVREGARLEQQGARFEQQAEQGNQVSGTGGGNGWRGDDGGYDNNGLGNSGYDKGLGNNSYNNGDGCGCRGGNQLNVNPASNTVDTGRYQITASNDNSGTLIVKDKETGQSFKVWGDPHISDSSGQSADFQHAPATFHLPDGTEITVTPTDNPGVNTIKYVTITKGNNAAEITGFGGNLQTQALPGEGRYLDATTPDGAGVWAENGNIGQLELADGSPIHGNIDSYASANNGQSDQISQLRQELAQIEQEIEQIEQGMNVTSLMSGGFMSNPLENCSFG